jgi:hypothetical protein
MLVVFDINQERTSMQRISWMKLTTIAAFLMVICAARPAAAKGFFLITHGDDIDHVHDIIPEARAEIASEFGGEPAIGYKYSSFGLFYLDIWTWGGEYVVYAGDSYIDVESAGLTDEDLAELAGVSSIDDLGKPWSYTFPPGLILIVLGIIGAAVYYKLQGKGDNHAEEMRGLFMDERYQEALRMMTPEEAEPPAEPEDGQEHETAAAEPKTFEQAVEYLISQGIPREQAEKNLGDLIMAMNADEEAA